MGDRQLTTRPEKNVARQQYHRGEQNEMQSLCRATSSQRCASKQIVHDEKTRVYMTFS